MSNKLIPYVVQTVTTTAPAVNVQQPWIGRKNKNLCAVLVTAQVPVNNPTAGDLDWDANIALAQMTMDLRTAAYGYLGQGVNLLYALIASVDNGYQPNEEFEDPIHTVPAAAVDEVCNISVLWPVTSMGYAAGDEGVIPSEQVLDYTIRCSNIMAGQAAGLTCTSPITVSITAFEMPGDPIFGRPLRLVTGAMTDSIERFRYPQPLNLAIFSATTAGVLANRMSLYTLALDGEEILSSVSGMLTHAAGQVSRIPDFRLDDSRVFELIAAPSNYIRADISEASLIELQKKDGAYTAGPIFFGLTYIMDQTTESLATAAVMAAGAGNSVAIQTLDGVAAVDSVSTAARLKMPLVQVKSAKAATLAGTNSMVRAVSVPDQVTYTNSGAASSGTTAQKFVRGFLKG